MSGMKCLDFFYDICKIPRRSGYEDGVVRYLREFALSRGLDFYTDGNRNVLINKPAAPGMEHCPPVCIQGHTDMVCEKTEDSVHSFDTDPIDVYTEDGCLRARGTTLGADDGAAVAYMLALLDDTTLSHPPLQCLFTAEEETGLYGAASFDYSRINSGCMINIDGEKENEILVSCAGGLRVHLHTEVRTEDGAQGFTVKIGGLAGGHSGADIHKNRMNASVLCARLARRLLGHGIRLVSLTGGTKDNAITPFAQLSFTTPEEAVIYEEISAFRSETEKSLSAEDSRFNISIKPAFFSRCMTKEDTARVIMCMASLKTGVIKMSGDIAGLVQTSANIGVADITCERADIYISTRSCEEEEKDALYEELAKTAEKYSFVSEAGQRYPGWKYKKTSRLRKLYAEAYKQTHEGREPDICAIHAGLECGITAGKKPDLDIIAIGPTMDYVHTVHERMEIESFCRIYKTVTLCLSMMKNKDLDTRA